MKKSATRRSGTMPVGRYHCPDAVVRPEDRPGQQARVVARDRALRIALDRNVAQANSRSRLRARAAWPRLLLAR